MRSIIVVSILFAMVASAAAEPVKTERRHSRVAAAETFAVIGGVFVGSAIAVGITAHRKYDDAFASGGCTRLDGTPICDAQGYQQSQNARTLGNLATGIGLTGTAMLATAAIVYFTAPRDTVTVAPTASADGAGLVVAGHF